MAGRHRRVQTGVELLMALSFADAPLQALEGAGESQVDAPFAAGAWYHC